MSQQGYRFGMRQPATHVQLGFKLPQYVDFTALDQWILDALECDIQSYQPQFIGAKPNGRPAEKFLIRWLCVTTLLLQDIRVPVFERAAIVSLKGDRKQPEHFVADIWFPVVEHFPAKLFHAWLALANQLIIDVLTHQDDPAALERLYQAFQRTQVLPWSAQIPGARSTIPILQAAFESGVPFAHSGFGRYVLGWGCQSRFFDRSSNMLDSAIGSVATQQKHIALQLMRSSGIPVPSGRVFKSGHPLTLAELTSLRPPWVVKPVDRDRGEGVTMGVATEEALQSAVANASGLSKQLLVEEQIEGTCHRILVIDGQVVYAVKRHPKSVVGDGVQSIAALVDQLNAAIRKKMPIKRLPDYCLDELALTCLKSAGLAPDSVLGVGQKAYLRPAQSTQWGGDPEEVTDHLHPDNAALAIRAARLFGLSCAGVDFISTDIARPWHQNGAVINEVNYSPVMGRTHPFQRKAARAYMASLFPTQGKIPIDVFIGKASRQSAKHQWQRLIDDGKRYIFCDEDGLLAPNGQPLQLAGAQSAYEKIAMLRTDASLDGLVVHAASADQLAANGQPFEYASIHGKGHR